MNLLGKVTEKEFWQAVREKDCYAKFREKYLERWAEECEDSPISSLKYSDWTEFWKSGKRIERNYFGARQQMMAAVFLSLIYPEEEKYLVRAMDQIFAICNEYTWCVPAHYGPIIDGNQVKIDLFAAETALGLAEVYCLLEDRLDEFIKIRIREELQRRIVDSMASTPKFGFESMSNNWSSVCTACVACTIMLMFPERFSEFRPRFEAAMEVFLSGYRDDGVCLEGSSYWGYGFGFFTIYAEMVNKFTNGEVNYYKGEKIKNIATFMQKTFLSENACVSFSDGARTGGFNVGLLHYLKEIYPDDVVLYKTEFSTKRDGCARFAMALMTVARFREDFYNNPEDDTAETTFYAENSEWLIKRTPDYGFAAKGGNNKEPHNHNDVGSFIYAKGGDQVLVDLGPGAYTKQYFSGERYKTFQACSRSHSVPIVGGSYQKNGPQHRAEDVSYADGVFTMNIASAYPVDGLNLLRRTFKTLECGISLSDEIDYTGEGVVTERFVTLREPKIGDGEITLTDTVLSYDKEIASPYVTEEVLSSGTVCYLINFDLPSGKCRFDITVK